MLNHIELQGRFTRNPELKTTGTGISVTTFTLACDRDYSKDAVDFVSCVAWRQTAEFVSKYFAKGQLAVVSGRLQSREWKDKDGAKHVAWEVLCDNVYFCEKRKEEQQDEDGDLPY